MNLSKIKELITSTYEVCEYPILHKQSNDWGSSQPLKGVRIIDATPLFRNTLTKHLALIAAGAELCIGISDGVPKDNKIVSLIKESGIKVITPNDKMEEVDIILDCAGSFANWQPRIGFVELTRSGVEYFKGCSKPVFVADSGKIKQIETTIGTGESYFRAMSQLGYNDWHGQKLIVFGGGKVGFGIIANAIKMGAVVTVVTDINTLSEKVRGIANKVIDYKEIEAICLSITDAYAVVTATGVVNALSNKTLSEALINSNALLANMGVEDEFGVEIDAQRVLEAKRPINFILEEPTQLKYLDAILALHNEGAIYILNNSSKSGLIEPPADIEDKLLKISYQQGVIKEEMTLLGYII